MTSQLVVLAEPGARVYPEAKSSNISASASAASAFTASSFGDEVAHRRADELAAGHRHVAEVRRVEEE